MCLYTVQAAKGKSLILEIMVFLFGKSSNCTSEQLRKTYFTNNLLVNVFPCLAIPSATLYLLSYVWFVLRITFFKRLLCVFLARCCFLQCFDLRSIIIEGFLVLRCKCCFVFDVLQTTAHTKLSHLEKRIQNLSSTILEMT